MGNENWIEKIIASIGIFIIPFGLGLMLVALALAMIFSSLPESDYQTCVNACRVSSEVFDKCISGCNETFPEKFLQDTAKRSKNG